MPELIPIGQFARLSGLSPRALRLYDEAQILTPAATSLATGYRYYSREQLMIARQIGESRRLDLSLAQIRVLFEAQEPHTIKAQLALHRTALERQRHLLERKLERMTTLEEVYTSPQQERGAMLEGARQIHTCSFCGKASPQVERMIAGPNSVIICNECVDLCNRIIATERASVTNEG